MTPTALFQSLWNDYIERLCPSADRVHQLLQEDEPLINDHIALRTFNLAPLGLETLAKPFLALGYQACGEYEFKVKNSLLSILNIPILCSLRFSLVS